MSFKKKEAKLLALLAVIVYALVFYKFIWVPVIPRISDIKDKISEAEAKKASLEKEVLNISTNIAELHKLNAMNERVDQYLMNSSFLVDNLEYVNKLGKYLKNNITELNVSSPQEKYTGLQNKDGGSASGKSPVKYYETKIEFNAHMTYGDAMRLVKYLEGAATKTRIKKFVVKPLSENRQAENVEDGEDTIESKYDINIIICLYSMNLRESDRMFMYSSYKLGSYMDGKGSVMDGRNLQSFDDETMKSADIVIKGKSYLSGGENLQILCRDTDSKVMRIKTDNTVDIDLGFTGTSYTLNAADASNNRESLAADIVSEEITILVDIDMPDIKENENIRLNIKINNGSSNRIRVILNDRQKRAKVFDRNGAEIHGRSALEKLDIF